MKQVYYLLVFSFFISVQTFAQQWVWGKIQSPINSEPSVVATDHKGNLYFPYHGPDTLSGWGMDLAKFDTNGNVIWNWDKLLKGTVAGSGTVFSISTDNFNNVYVLGTVNGPDTLIFERDTIIVPNNLPISSEYILIKFNSSGNVLWVRQSVVTDPRLYHSYMYPTSVTTDKAGNIYVTGNFIGSYKFGNDTLNNQGMFLVKYDSSGHISWSRQSDSIGYSTYSTVSTDAMGNIYVAGIYGQAIRFGKFTLPPPPIPGGDMFLTKYNSAGSVIWAKYAQLPSGKSSCDSYSLSSASDKRGNTYITGSFSDTVTFGSHIVIAHTPEEIFVVKYDSAGDAIWAKQSFHYDVSQWYGFSLAIDTLNHEYISGGTGNASSIPYTIRFGTCSFTENQLGDFALLVELDSNGNSLCASLAMSGGDDYNGVACDPTGRFVYMGGDVDALSVIFGPDTLYPSGENNFVGRWESCTPFVFTGNESITSKLDCILYPNPNNGRFTIEVNSEKLKVNREIDVYNMFGEKIYTSLLNNASLQINLSGQPAGVYLYRVMNETGNLVSSGKLIIE